MNLDEPLDMKRVFSVLRWVFGVVLGVLLVRLGSYWLAVGVVLGLLMARGVFEVVGAARRSLIGLDSHARPARQSDAPRGAPADDPYREPPARCPTCGAGHIASGDALLMAQLAQARQSGLAARREASEAIARVRATERELEKRRS